MLPSKFISQVPAKRCGVLNPIAKFPSFVERMEGVVRGSDAANMTYQKLCKSLFKLLETVAQQDEKYVTCFFLLCTEGS